MLVLIPTHRSFHPYLHFPGLPAPASLQGSSADRFPKMPLEVYGNILLARKGTHRRCHLQRRPERAAGKARGRQKSQGALQSLVNMPKDFISEGRLLGSDDSFSIDMEDGSCQAPLQNGHCRRKRYTFQRFQAPERCCLPLTHGSEGVQCSWFPQKLSPSSPHPPHGVGARGTAGHGAARGHGGAAGRWGHRRVS